MGPDEERKIQVSLSLCGPHPKHHIWMWGEGAWRQEHVSPPSAKAGNKIPHFKIHRRRQNLVHFNTKLFPSFCFSTCLMRDFWEMKKMSPPTASSLGFFFTLWKESVRGKELLKHVVLTPNLKKSPSGRGCGPHLALDLGFWGLRK